MPRRQRLADRHSRSTVRLRARSLLAAASCLGLFTGLGVPGVAGAQIFTRGNQLLNAAPDDFHCGEQTATGDFNGDGFADLAIGMPQAAVGAIADAGLVRVWSGSNAGLVDPVEFRQGLDSVPGVPEEGDGFGSDLAAGDFDGDGYDDLAVSAYFEDIAHAGNPVADAGVVEILFGSSSGLSGLGSVLWSEESAGIAGNAEEEDYFGSLAVADFDGDAHDDLVIGASYKDNGAFADSGRVWVLPGSASGPTATGSLTFNQATLGGSLTAFIHLGTVFAGGDFDGDGFDELAIGLPGQAVNGHIDAGAVWIVSGSAAGLTFPGTRITQGATLGSGTVAGQAEENDAFGQSLASADFDRESPQEHRYQDLAIGVVGETNGHGAVEFLAGGPGGLTGIGSFLFTENDIPGGAATPIGFGRALAAGPLYSPFRGDLVIAASLDSVDGLPGVGRVAVVPGSSIGLRPGQATLLDASIPGLASGPPTSLLAFGISLAVGNFDGRGVRDIAIGVSGYGPVNEQGRHPGGVQILYSALFASDFETHNFSQWSSHVP